MKALLIFLLVLSAATCWAASSVVVTSGSIVCVNQAHIIIDNGAGDLTINDVDGFFSDNTASVNGATVFEGPEGAYDALTITPAAPMGTVQIFNYSGMRHPSATTTKIKRWWNMVIPTTSISTIDFKVRTGNDCTGFVLASLSPYEWFAGNWVKMTTAAPTVSTVGQYSSLIFTGVNFSAKKGNHIITLGSGDGTLPVELSSFTALPTAQSNVRLDWITQSETGVLGYYIYRNVTENLNSAELVSPLIAATNTSVETAYSFTDREVPGDGTYYYWLLNMDIDGAYQFHGAITATVQTDNPDNPVIPLETSLGRPYPNPFNPSVTIAYGLAKAAHVQILIYNQKGQKVCTLLQADKNPGLAKIVWNGTNSNGKSLSSGIYYIKMTAGKYSSMQKVILLK